MDLGYKLKKIREGKKLSQQELADYLGVSQKTYSNYESCRSMPSLKQLCKISKILDLNLFDIFNELGITIGTSIDSQLITDKTPPDNQLKDLLIKNYQTLIKDKDEIITLLKEKIILLQKH